MIQKNLFTEQKQTHTDLENELMVCRQGQEWREETVGEFGMDMYILLYLKWITNKVLLYDAGNSALCSVADWMGAEFEGEWIQVCVWLSPFAVT